MSAWEYIYLAIGSGVLGIGLTFVVVMVCQYFNIDIFQHLWVVSIPIVVSLLLNVILIEVYHVINKRKK